MSLHPTTLSPLHSIATGWQRHPVGDAMAGSDIMLAAQPTIDQRH
jgi:hypothetical protein